MQPFAAEAQLVVRVQARGGQVARRPWTDNLVSLEMGGCVESSSRSWSAEYAHIRLLDGDLTTT